MTPIQPILIIGIGASLVVYLRFFRNQLRDRAIALVLAASAVAVVVFPDLTTEVAHRVGVGRGVDLLLYIFMVLAVFVGVLVFSRVSTLEQQHTRLVRQLAILGARPAPPRPAGAPPN